MSKEIWVISVCNTKDDGVWISRVRGTKKKVKEYLFSFAAEDMASYGYDDDEENIDESYGVKSINDVVESRDGKELNIYATYSNFHIDYTASLQSNLKIQEL